MLALRKRPQLCGVVILNNRPILVVFISLGRFLISIIFRFSACRAHFVKMKRVIDALQISSFYKDGARRKLEGTDSI
jgi:hypothetical protein